MPDFISKEDAATLARALNSRRFGLFNTIIGACWALFFPQGENLRLRKQGDVSVEPSTDECRNGIAPRAVRPDA